MGEPSGTMGRRERPGIQNYTTSTLQQQSPPAYSTISYNNETPVAPAMPTTDMGPMQLYDNDSAVIRQNATDHHRRHTTTNFPITQQNAVTTTTLQEKTPSAAACHTMPRLPSARRATDPAATLTAQDVAQLLRPSAAFQLPFQRRNTMHLHHRGAASTISGTR